MVLQFSLAGEELWIWVAVLDERRLSLSVLSCKRNKAGVKAVKINSDFVLAYSLFYAGGAAQFQADKLPRAFRLYAAL